jgi:hypothetical protein
MRNDDLNRRDLNRTDTSMGGTILAAMAAIAIIAALFIWAPWTGPKTADNASPSTTVGSSTSRPAVPGPPPTAAPTTPSTTR